MPQTHSTAILIFSRSPQEEAACKSYVRHRHSNLQIARKVLARTLEAASFSALPVIRRFSNRQHGASFGERLANAIEEVFAAGYSNVIALGSDTPGIHAGIIGAIASQVNDHVLVTGPSADGGVYAIGLSAASWDRDAFINIAWQTDKVQQQLGHYAALVNARQANVEHLWDIDDCSSFYTWLRTAGAGNNMAGYMSRLLNGSLFFAGQDLIASSCQQNGISHRGPPLAA